MGCCGALDVTIRREGGEVVWDGWARPDRRDPVGPLRFEAAAYDAEIARAESDHAWAWPARRTARLIAAALRDRPGLAARWDCRSLWAGTRHGEPDTTELRFASLAGGSARGGRRDAAGRWCSRGGFPEDGRTPEERAAAALDRLAAADPRTYADVAGGSREAVEALRLPGPGRAED